MVTDPAPVDLVLQRSGRLHRHSRTRPAGLSQPVLWISEPGRVSRGVPAFDDGTKAVYDAHILLRSWMVLHETSAIGVPEEIEDLIETVYGQGECPASAGEELQT
jgi:CRISPR-associated endonuclease/helicase Cas3